MSSASSLCRSTARKALSAVAEPRRQFVLPEEDQAFVESLNLPWETLRDGNSMWLLLHDYDITAGYMVQQASVGLLVPANYPTAQLDMAYFYPHLVRVDGQPIGQLSNHPIDGRPWQRWSRHRSADNAWRPEIDNIATHLVLVDGWLQREVQGGAR